MLNMFAVHLHPICCLKIPKMAFWRCRLPQIYGIINFLACENVKSIVQKLWLKTVKSPRLFARGVISIRWAGTIRHMPDAWERLIRDTNDWRNFQVIGGNPENLIRPHELMLLTSGYQAKGNVESKEMRPDKERVVWGSWQLFSFGQLAWGWGYIRPAEHSVLQFYPMLREEKQKEQRDTS